MMRSAELDARPLFLGADVLNGTAVDSKNNGRIHQRYAREGLTTKLRCLDVKLAGLQNLPQGAWFYSIQGVMHAVFEHHSREVQRLVLHQLKDLWLERYNDGLLQPLTQVSLLPVDVAIATNQPAVVVIATSDDVGSGKEAGEECIVADMDIGLECECVDYIDVTPTHNVAIFHIKHVTKYLSNVLQRKDIRSDDVTRSRLTDLVMLIKEYANDIQGHMTFPYHLVRQFSVLKQDRTLIRQFKAGFGVSHDHMALLCLVSEWLGQQYSALSPAIADHVQTFKLQHIHSIQNLPEPRALVGQLFPECMTMLLLNWMANQPNAMSSAQHQSEAQVKGHHENPVADKINHDSTDAETSQNEVSNLVDTVEQQEANEYPKTKSSSPQHKKVFMSSAHLQNEAQVKGHHEKPVADKINHDSTAEPPHKKVCSHSADDNENTRQQVDLFPFVQVVLEFLNNTLISGVAHVVYSRLIRGNM